VTKQETPLNLLGGKFRPSSTMHKAQSRNTVPINADLDDICRRKSSLKKERDKASQSSSVHRSNSLPRHQSKTDRKQRSSVSSIQQSSLRAQLQVLKDENDELKALLRTKSRRELRNCQT